MQTAGLHLILQSWLLRFLVRGSLSDYFISPHLSFSLSLPYSDGSDGILDGNYKCSRSSKPCFRKCFSYPASGETANCTTYTWVNCSKLWDLTELLAFITYLSLPSPHVYTTHHTPHATHTHTHTHAHQMHTCIIRTHACTHTYYYTCTSHKHT